MFQRTEGEARTRESIRYVCVKLGREREKVSGRGYGRGEVILSMKKWKSTASKVSRNF